ncbi:hypothetical protein Kpho02_76550 [Kitasatospora phosalacinea]|uniref:Uncharacterized protein n=1 Tax=Kitasatospora phosalacinea TaxID=2065 RepID=A0A9W6QI46_9ACTN|nr:hypothetical protein Kpho02_76550 [Kitasatospora phosalacinea]
MRAGIAVLSLCRTAECSVCGDLVEGTVGSRGWGEGSDGRLVYDRNSPEHNDVCTVDGPELTKTSSPSCRSAAEYVKRRKGGCPGIMPGQPPFVLCHGILSVCR